MILCGVIGRTVRDPRFFGGPFSLCKTHKIDCLIRDNLTEAFSRWFTKTTTSAKPIVNKV